MNVFIDSIPNVQEKKTNNYANKKSLLLALNLRNDNIISQMPGLKMDVKNVISGE